MRNFGFWLVVGGLLGGCSKTEPVPSQVSAPAPNASGVDASGALSSDAAPGPVAVAAPTAAPPLTAPGPPASFKEGAKEPIGGAVGLGCEATSLDGWLQLLCRKKNGTGGHPVRAFTLDPSAKAATEEEARGQELTTDEQGELTIVVPYAGEAQRDVTIEWTDTSYTLHVKGAKATLEWAAAGLPHRRACQKLMDENKAVVAAAQRAEGEARLTTTEAAKLPRFGTCREGGLGSWALSLAAIRGKGEGAARTHRLELEVVRIDVEGSRKAARFGAVEVAPGGFELAALQVYDYDDDGRDELIVPYELKAGSSEATFPPPIWAFDDAGVAPYAHAPAVNGGVAVEQLDFDMRPDLSTYGPFVVYFDADCGIKACPARITGPKLYWHSTQSGTFADADEASRSALKRSMCQKKPERVVVEASGSLNVAQTAKNLVCARAYGASADAVATELTEKHAALCGDAVSCALESTLKSWAKLPVPVDLATK
ncbi:MAG: hypothetical protein K0R38_1511 [Polyangiaceae bacterium]|jgi:hypothetical protein|nr:hypothetical protein [Polyangiaceae bacterium]